LEISFSGEVSHYVEQPGQRGKCDDLPCSSIFSANRDDIAATQFQKQFWKKA